MSTTVKSYTKVLLFVTHFVTLMMKSRRNICFLNGMMKKKKPTLKNME